MTASTNSNDDDDDDDDDDIKCHILSFEWFLQEPRRSPWNQERKTSRFEFLCSLMSCKQKFREHRAIYRVSTVECNFSNKDIPVLEHRKQRIIQGLKYCVPSKEHEAIVFLGQPAVLRLGPDREERLCT